MEGGTEIPDEIIFAEIIEVDEKERTSDVQSDGSFKSLLLSQSTLDNLQKHGFKKPSPVQVKAIPPGISGLDMLVQAKSGTGKTLVFAILAVENLKLSSKAVQKLVLAPTREIALQIGDTIQKLAPKGTKIGVMTGGTSVHDDKEKLKKGLHVVVGTTGRLCQLASDKSLNLGSLSLFVLDEADKMMSEAFEQDVNYLYSCVPSMRQVAVFSATYPPHLASSLTRFLRSAIHVRLNADDVQLVGIKQYVSFCTGIDPIHATITALSSIQFKQAFIFCNKAGECARVVDRLMEKGIETAGISGQLEQSEREDVVKRLKEHTIKVLVSTDLTSRGLDADNVDLVINIEPPFEVETYFHRIGRAARYGGQGASLTLLSDKRNVSRFAFLVRDGGIRAKILHIDSIPPTLTSDRNFFDASQIFVSEAGKGRTEREGATNGDERKDDAENEDPTQNLATLNSEDQDQEDKMTTDYSVLLEKAFDLSSSLKNSVPITKNEDVGQSETTEVKGKKFKFVPSRAKKSTKYYMKGEMMSIRDSLSPQQWFDYASTKFDMKCDPFIGSEEKGEKKTVEKEKKEKKWERATKIEPRASSTPSPLDGIKEYSRKDMFAISKSKPGKVWRSYAESKWDLKEDPFVMEQWMRCSFTERIRQERKREKEARDKVVAERNASRARLLSMGTATSPFPQWNGSFEEYCKEMKKTMENENGKMRRGPIVSRRREPHEYRRIVEETRRKMEQVERSYEYLLKIALKGVNEGGMQTEKMEEEEGEGRMEEEEEERVEQVVEEDNDEDEEEEEEEEVDEEEEEEYNDSEDDESEGDSQSRLYVSYNRNIEFARVFNAYLSSMSSYR